MAETLSNREYLRELRQIRQAIKVCNKWGVNTGDQDAAEKIEKEIASIKKAISLDEAAADVAAVNKILCYEQ